ncbi:MAG: hypothetical protein QG665_296 [Patescibacteria group bacterium]|nr:hypothetical protein [Patescibacteria group bacterium]
MSVIGGIVISVDLLIILFFCIKWYRNWDNGLWENNREIACLAIYSVIFLSVIPLKMPELHQYSAITTPLGLLMHLSIPAHLVLSVTRRIPLGYIGVVTFFERPVFSSEKEGPVFVPLGTHQLRVLPRKQREIEIPGPPDKIWRGEIDLLPEGKLPAFRVTHAETDNPTTMSTLSLVEYKIPLDKDGKVDQEKIDFLRSDRYTAEYEMRAKYRLTDAGDFHRNFDGIPEFEQIAEDAIKGTMQTILPTLTIGTTIENLGKISEALATNLRTKIADRNQGTPIGVKIEDVEIKTVTLSHSLNTSMMLRIQARYDRQTKITSSKAEAESALLIGNAKAVVEAAPYREQAKLWQELPQAQVAFTIDAMRDAVSASKPVVMTSLGGTQTSDLAGALMALVGQTIANNPPNQQP